MLSQHLRRLAGRAARRVDVQSDAGRGDRRRPARQSRLYAETRAVAETTLPAKLGEAFADMRAAAEREPADPAARARLARTFKEGGI